MRRLVFAAAILGALAPPAAADISVFGEFSQRFDATDQGDLGSTTDIGVTTRRAGPFWSTRFNIGARLIARHGDDDDAIDVLPRFRADGSLRGKRQTLTGSLSVTPRFTAFTNRFEIDAPADPDDDLSGPPPADEIDDQVRVVTADEVDGVEVQITGRLNWRYRLSQTDSAGLGLFVNAREFTAGASGFTPTREVGLTSSYDRRLTNRTTFGGSLGASRFMADDADGDRIVDSLTPRFTFNHTVTRSLALDGSLGATIARREDDSPNGADDTTSITPVGDLGFNFTGFDTDDNRFRIGVSQRTVGADDGDFESRTSLNLGWTARLTPQTVFRASGSIGVSQPLFDEDGGDESVFVTLSPSITHQIDEDWRLVLSYRGSTDDEDLVGGASHDVFLRLSRGFAILP